MNMEYQLLRTIGALFHPSCSCIDDSQALDLILTLKSLPKLGAAKMGGRGVWNTVITVSEPII